MKITYLDYRTEEEKAEQDYIIILSDDDFFDNEYWRMEINLTEIINNVGKKKLYENDRGEMINGIIFPISELKRLIRIICRYGTAETISGAKRYIEEKFPKGAKYFHV